MPLTRRGKAVVFVCVTGFVLAGLFGARALNAVVLPGVVALVAGYLQVSRLSTPRTVRDAPPNDFRGATHEVSVGFAGVDRPFVGRVEDAVSEELDAEGAAADTAVGGDPVTYRVTYASRGEATLGPAHVVGQDVLGLFERDFLSSGTDTVLVYPAVFHLDRWARRDLVGLHDTILIDERDEFDTLREYVRGDSLRDVHWKSSAKRDDLIVKEFVADREAEAVTIAASATADGVDAMADAVASVASALLEADVPVSVVLADDVVEAGPGRGTRTDVLERLARAGPGSVTADADVAVHGSATEARVQFAGHDTSFENMLSGRSRETPDPTVEAVPT